MIASTGDEIELTKTLKYLSSKSLGDSLFEAACFALRRNLLLLNVYFVSSFEVYLKLLHLSLDLKYDILSSSTNFEVCRHQIHLNIMRKCD